MRKFDDWLSYRTEEAFNTKIFYVDLSTVIKKNNYTSLSLGYKVRDSRNAHWQNTELYVETDFTEDEFIKTCEKYNVKYSVYIGE